MAKNGSKERSLGRDDTLSSNGGSAGDGWKKYPLHMAVWLNDLTQLRKLLISIHEKHSGLVRDGGLPGTTPKEEKRTNSASLESELELVDPRGRTALLLAVCLDHYECAKLLLEYGASAGVRLKNPAGETEEVDPTSDSAFTAWSAVHEATCTGDVQLLSLILQHRDAERQKVIGNLDTKLLEQLRYVPDFYVEMKWEFTSWIPFVSKLCPSDTCRIYKKGANVRLDTTLVGFENTSWIRGLRSFLFVEKDGEMAFHEVDHDEKIVRTEKKQMAHVFDENELDETPVPSEQVLAQRMRTPVMLTTLDTQKVHFERARSGLLWRSDKTEVVSGQSCKVYSASNVTFVTRSRSEHLTSEDKKKLRDEIADHPLNGVIPKPQEEEPPEPPPGTEKTDRPSSSSSSSSGDVASYGVPVSSAGIAYEEYFDAAFDLGSRDIGRPKNQKLRSKTFKSNLWLCDEYPLSLRKQVLPIVDMMAATNANFAKLHDFISLHLPSGFPVKIEIPLFHVLTAKVTFENIFGSISPVENGRFIPSENGVADSCDIADSVFEIPPDYQRETIDSWLQDIMDEDLNALNNDVVPDSDLEDDPEAFQDALPNDEGHGEPLQKDRSAERRSGNRPKSDLAVARRLSKQEMARRAEVEEDEKRQLEEALLKSLQEK